MACLRQGLQVLRIAASLVTLSALGLAAPLAAVNIDSARAAPSAVTVAEASVLSSPYTVELAPDGELRVLSFPDALVSSVVVAKPWLITALVQGHDVVLQAKASNGETQAIVYANAAGTLWNIVIAPHKPVASRIVIAASSEESALPPSSPRPIGGARSASPTPQRMNPKLAAFAEALSADQRVAFEAWQRDPTAEKLTAFLAVLDTTRRAEFERLISAGAVAVSAAIVAPRLVETTTIIPAPGQPASRTVPPSNVTSGFVPMPGATLYAYPTGVPTGIALTTAAERAGDSVVVRYTIHNGLPVSLQNGTVSAVDGHGAGVVLKNDGPSTVAPGTEVRGSISVPAFALPVTLHWTWTRAAVQRVPLVGIQVHEEQGTAGFYILVAP